MTNERVPGHTTLRASWTLERGGLIVTYTITSAEPHRNLLTFDGGRGDPSCEVPNLTDQVYVSFEQPNTVHIKRVSPPITSMKVMATGVIQAVRGLEHG